MGKSSTKKNSYIAAQCDNTWPKSILKEKFSKNLCSSHNDTVNKYEKKKYSAEKKKLNEEKIPNKLSLLELNVEKLNKLNFENNNNEKKISKKHSKELRVCKKSLSSNVKYSSSSVFKRQFHIRKSSLENSQHLLALGEFLRLSSKEQTTNGILHVPVINQNQIAIQKNQSTTDSNLHDKGLTSSASKDDSLLCGNSGVQEEVPFLQEQIELQLKVEEERPTENCYRHRRTRTATENTRCGAGMERSTYYQYENIGCPNLEGTASKAHGAPQRIREHHNHTTAVVIGAMGGAMGHSDSFDYHVGSMLSE